MDPFHFACPHCSSPLRVRDKLYVGRHVECPECGQSLRIVQTTDGMGVERPPTPQSTPKSNQPPRPDASLGGVPRAAGSAAAAQPATAEKSAIVDSPRRSFRKPQPLAIVAGLIVLAGLICGLALYFKPAGGPSLASDGPRDPIAAADSGQPAQGDRTEPEQPHNDEPPRTEVEQRLSTLGEALLEFAAADGTLPSGTVPILRIAAENRLSWMAQLAERLDDGSAPDPVWDRPWNSPQNEPFVRRRLTMFQNPAIAGLTGGDGYPASHFAGVAGVGIDAARLDRSHARAGVFGYDRRTRLDDIRDGASNTLMVLGVRDQLGSWGAGGAATVRALTREPYINGPDGFGTGSLDGMHALLADGRVVSLSSRIDPRILRRMAAMADGYSLDESEPGEPGDRPSLLAGEPGDDRDGPDADDLARDDPPIEPEFAPEPAAARKIDLNVTLKQPIVRFDQPRSKTLAEVLLGVAEMAGTHIAYNREELGPAADRLTEPVVLQLENTTVGDILTGLLRPAGLTFRIEGDHLRLVPRDVE